MDAVFDISVVIFLYGTFRLLHGLFGSLTKICFSTFQFSIYSETIVECNIERKISIHH